MISNISHLAKDSYVCADHCLRLPHLQRMQPRCFKRCSFRVCTRDLKNTFDITAQYDYVQQLSLRNNKCIQNFKHIL